MKKILLVVMVLAIMFTLSGCGNYSIIDTKWKFDTAMIELPGGEIVSVNVKSWTDADDGDQITVVSEDGTVYMVHSVNCALIER